MEMLKKLLEKELKEIKEENEKVRSNIFELSMILKQLLSALKNQQIEINKLKEKLNESK